MKASGVQAIAKYLNVTVRRVQQLAKDGMPRKGRGVYDLVKCMNWYIRYLQENMSTTEHEPLIAERQRLIKIQADIKEIQLAKLRGELIVRNHQNIAKTAKALHLERNHQKPLTVQEMGRLGGKARAAKLSKKQLSEIGKKAVSAREAKRALIKTGNRRPKLYKKCQQFGIDLKGSAKGRGKK